MKKWVAKVKIYTFLITLLSTLAGNSLSTQLVLLKNFQNQVTPMQGFGIWALCCYNSN